MKLVVGLGNPGKEYERTRHNVGFMVIDAFLETCNVERVTSFDKKSNSQITQINIQEKKILLIKPQTFMNNSGLAVQALVDFYKLTSQDIVVIHDEKDIPLGSYKIQTNRGAAGHNGVQSIIDHLGTKNFTRIRVGVGPEDKKIDYIEGYVMEKFSKEERKKLEEVIKEVIKKIVREIK